MSRKHCTQEGKDGLQSRKNNVKRYSCLCLFRCDNATAVTMGWHRKLLCSSQLPSYQILYRTSDLLFSIYSLCAGVFQQQITWTAVAPKATFIGITCFSTLMVFLLNRHLRRHVEETFPECRMSDTWYQPSSGSWWSHSRWWAHTSSPRRTKRLRQGRICTESDTLEHTWKISTTAWELVHESTWSSVLIVHRVGWNLKILRSGFFCKITCPGTPCFTFFHQVKFWKGKVVFLLWEHAFA